MRGVERVWDHDDRLPGDFGAVLTDRRALSSLVKTFRRYLHLPDPTALHVVLAVEIANRIEEGEPVWQVILGGSSRGKTELLMPLDGLDGVRVTGALSVPSLLSGTPKKERESGATGGLLYASLARAACSS